MSILKHILKIRKNGIDKKYKLKTNNRSYRLIKNTNNNSNNNSQNQNNNNSNQNNINNPV